MGELSVLVGGLLSRLHGLVGIPFCPGDWIWTITVAGMLLALSPVVAACLVALTRRFTGNRYSIGIVLLFAFTGVLGTALLPLLGFVGTATVVRQAALGSGATGLTGQDVANLQDSYCFLPVQASYLGGGGRTVGDALRELPGPDLLLGGRALLLLVAAPLVAWMLIWVLARLAVRRGPGWPSMLLWLPFLALPIGTLSVDEGTVSQLWVGYTVGIVPGLAMLLLIGRPRWSVINQTRTPPPQVTPQQAPSRKRASRKPAAWKSAPRQPAPGDLPPPRRPQPTLALPQGQQAAPKPRPTEHLPMPLAPTTPRYRRLRRLGEGGFGEVWLAMDTVLDREVAIKVARSPDPDTERRIGSEARALAAVSHPHCVRVYDVLSELDDLPGLAIVMEYIAGPSLARQVSAQGPVSDSGGAHLWSTLAGALEAAHERGVLHRDVKPSNVIIDHAGKAHLIDFGIARATGDPALTSTGMIIGTPDFLAPEVAAGAAADQRSDSWQLAATVSYALSGQPPRGHRDDAVAALRAAASQKTAIVLPDRSAHRDLLGRALHPNPRRRPTLATVQAELTEWLVRTGRPEHGPITRTLVVPPEFSG